MDYRLDEIDRRIIYELMRNAHDTTAPAIAEATNVSSGTIRNRINQLEDYGIIRSYTTEIDFERADDRLTNLYICTAPISERKSLAREAHSIPGVINVRELMTGRKNLHILAVGEDTESLRRVARALSGLGIEVEDETLLEAERHVPYAPFGPDRKSPASDPTDVISLTGGAEVVDVTISSEAPIVGLSLKEAVAEGVLDEDTLVIAVERGDSVITPDGTTTIQADDIVTVLCRRDDTDRVLEPFIAEEVNEI
ncbi:Lrp/AsnC family transcriptional regulator [Halopenitus sp. POP-27]|uniref:Lrp/AsnC family transcriptional regulator n=1 Tax=Halopenitus sp. POP-27 TaxID=2994425 RepID=UPI002469C013|nr:Lrp/AsnC family transcriptional regulator [Halopenitus sp. POP-27]